MYLYRTSPRIDTGDRHYISRYERAVDEETMLADDGSGGYYGGLKNAKTRSAVATHAFSLYRFDAPPKVDPATVIKCPENDTYFNSSWAKQPQASSPGPPPSANPVSTATPTAAPPPAGNTVVDALVDSARRQAERPVVDPQLAMLWEKTAADRDALAAKLAEFSSKPAPPPAPTIAAPPPAPDPVEQLSKLLTLLEQFKPPTPPPVEPRSAIESIREIAEAMNALRELQQPQQQKEPDNRPADSSGTRMTTFERAMVGLIPAITPARWFRRW